MDEKTPTLPQLAAYTQIRENKARDIAQNGLLFSAFFTLVVAVTPASKWWLALPVGFGAISFYSSLKNEYLAKKARDIISEKIQIQATRQNLENML
jgi:hypothetical protein